MKIHTVPIDSIVPYWRNPRKISNDHVEKVAESIKRFGYQSPIIVDSDMTVIVGHTRLQALRTLGHDTVDVVVADLDEKQVKEYRLIDNRTSENGQWDTDKLFLELREFTDMTLADIYFPEITFDVPEADFTMRIDADQVEKANDALINKTSVTDSQPKRTLNCPHCFEEFTVTI